MKELSEEDKGRLHVLELVIKTLDKPMKKPVTDQQRLLFKKVLEEARDELLK